uniref:Uncharacterized protein n=1 Tax=Ciona savignyi TaxID=51511 RepID=H2Y773_CIOSA
MVVGQFKVRSATNVWKPVSVPIPKGEKLNLQTVHPPPTAHKPGGKVYVYMYEAPENGSTYSQGGKIPANGKIFLSPPANGPPYKFPCSNEIGPTNGRKTPEVRLKERSKKNSKGYKVIADVTNKTERPSSRGGRMFMKQKDRMDKFTSPGSVGQRMEERPSSPVGMESTPWDSPESNPNIKYLPVHVYNAPFKNGYENGENPHFLSPEYTRHRPESAGGGTAPPRAWNQSSMTSPRCGSAPPHELNNGDDQGCITGTINGCKAGSKYGVSAASLSFNARKHKANPCRGGILNRGVYVTQPHAHLDFNARAVGWNRDFARNYYAN